MRADNNWEDKVGKRLHDFEGELSPQAWNNISKKIQPKQRNRWFFWLPLILILFSVPAGLYFSGKLKTVPSNEEKPVGSISSESNNGNTIALNQASKPAETLAEKEQKIAQPAGNKTLTETQKGKIQVAEKEASSTPEINEEPVLNSETQVEIKRPKKKAFVFIPGKDSKKSPASEKSSEAERSESARKANKPASYSATEFAARSNKKNAGKQGGKIGITSNQKPEVTGNYIALEKSNTSSLSKKVDAGINGISTGKNLAAEKNKVVQQTSNQTEIAKEITNLNSRPEITDPEKAGSKPEQIVGDISGKTDNNNLTPATADSLLAKADSLAAKNIAKADTTEKKKEKQKKQLAFSIYATPQYNFQRVTPNENDDTKILSLNNKNDFESERLGYEFGLRGYYPLKEKLQLEFGFQLARVTQHLSFTTASQFADSAVVYQQGNTLNMDVYNRELKQLYLIKYTLAGFYAGLNRTIGNNLDLNGGIGANWILSSKTVPASTQISNASFSPFLSAGLNYHWSLSKTLELQAGPNIQYYLKPLQKEDGLFCTEPTVLGIKVSLLFK
jgi:hypothetical protein